MLQPGVVALIRNAHGDDRGETACDAVTAAKAYLGRMEKIKAWVEGWDLFEVDGRLQLQRIDAPDLGDLGYGVPKFASDADALIFVALQAHAGSAYHRDAIERIGTLAD